MGGGDDSSIIGFLDDLDEEESRIANAKLLEKLQRLRLGRGFQDEDEAQRFIGIVSPPMLDAAGQTIEHFQDGGALPSAEPRHEVEATEGSAESDSPTEDESDSDEAILRRALGATRISARVRSRKKFKHELEDASSDASEKVAFPSSAAPAQVSGEEVTVPSYGALLAEIDRLQNEEDEPQEVSAATPAGRARRKGLFSSQLEEAGKRPEPVASAAAATPTAIAAAAGGALPGLQETLAAIDQDVLEEEGVWASRQTFFQLGRVKPERGEWSDSDEESTAAVRSSSPFHPPDRRLAAAEDEEATFSEDDRPSRSMQLATASLEARRKRREDVRVAARQRYSEVLSDAIYSRSIGRSSLAPTVADAASGSGQKAAAMPKSQVIGGSLASSSRAYPSRLSG